MWYKAFACMLFVLCIQFTKAQNLSDSVQIENAIASKEYEKAAAILERINRTFLHGRQPDSLVKYLYYNASVTEKRSSVSIAEKKLEEWLRQIKNLTPQAETLMQAYIEAGEYYGVAGLINKGYEANKTALHYALQSSTVSKNKLGSIENNLATFAQRLGKTEWLKYHSGKAIQYLTQSPHPDYEKLYMSYNGLGNTMWYASRLDSAAYYYLLALETLKKTDSDPSNQFYRPAIVLNNLSAVYNQNGKITLAIEALNKTIQNLNEFELSDASNAKKEKARTFQFEATDNLAGIYKDLGDYNRARQLLEYSYTQKQKYIGKDEPGIYISQILLGQIYYALRDYDKAILYLSRGIDNMSKADGDNLFWQADACNTLALLYDDKKDISRASFFYKKADSLYLTTLQDEYDDIYLDFLRNQSLFYAENGQSDLAIKKATEGYRYLLKTQGPTSLPVFNQVLNLAKIYYLSGQYKVAAQYSQKGLELVNTNIRTSNNLLDSIKMELHKPKAILLQAQSEYQLLPNKNVENLKSILTRLKDALYILERRKTIINDPANITVLMVDHNDLLEFVKQITLEIYTITHEQAYADELINLQESGLYNRIRSRLDKNDSILYAHVPLAIQEKEKTLKASIAQALQGTKAHKDHIENYIKAIKEQEAFYAELRKKYPQYYSMRYENIFKSSDAFQQAIPEKVTAIRYFFVGKKLLAFVMDKNQKQLIPLSTDRLQENITLLTSQKTDVHKNADLLYSLYQTLWAPIEKEVKNNKVIIIPDGILYSLNFDLLTPQKIKSYRELAQKGLLAQYSFSYDYSLFLVGKKNTSTNYSNSFIAFAPGFSDEVKSKYKAVSGKNELRDQAYLRLLPQPFTTALAHKLNQKFGGQVYLDQSSTRSAFIEKAGNHSVIHLGTHAFSNNEHPEFSKLIFTKNHPEEQNEMYASDIYNCNLSSDLTVLSACETGMPGYLDGEGMVSLAHAFNYAGSESIVTSLWKIDEKAGAILMESFYENLGKGMEKDDALREAKLQYLKESDGRMLDPQYWGGLVIMGDTNSVTLKQKTSPFIRLAIAIGMLGLGFLFYRHRRAK